VGLRGEGNVGYIGIKGREKLGIYGHL